MSTFQRSMETVFTGIFGCGCKDTVIDEIPGEVIPQTLHPSLFRKDRSIFGQESNKENHHHRYKNNNNQSSSSSLSKSYYPRGMVPCDDDSFLNETGTTAQDSFFSDSSSDSPFSKLQQSYRRRSPCSTPPILPREAAIASNPWSHMIPVPKRTKAVELPLVVGPPSVRRLTLEDAALQRDQPGAAITMATQRKSRENDGSLYDTDGSPMELPDAFLRNRSLDFLFSFPSTSR